MSIIIFITKKNPIFRLKKFSQNMAYEAPCKPASYNSEKYKAYILK